MKRYFLLPRQRTKVHWFWYRLEETRYNMCRLTKISPIGIGIGTLLFNSVRNKLITFRFRSHDTATT